MRTITEIAEYNAKYYLAHCKEIAEYNAKYRAKHKEDIAKQKAKYHAAHREELVEYSTKYYLAHREEHAKWYAEWYVTHREEIAKQHTEYRAAHRAEQAWVNMHERAENQDGKNPSYANVKVCKRWSGPKGKENFVKDMGQPPKGTSLSRFGDIGNYSKANCAWHTRAQQAAEAATKRKKHAIAS